MKTAISEILLLFIFAYGCVDSYPRSMLSNYDFKKGKSSKLTGKLTELSGLTVTPDGRVFAHNDEKGIVYQINYETGEIVKEFYLSRWVPERDFEGIAYANKNFYLVTSDGLLYEFPEGKHEEAVDFKIYKTGANSEFNIEGLCYDNKTNSLLFVCKEYPGKNYSGNRAVYSFSLKNYLTDKNPRLLISLKELNEKFGIKDFYPSGIEKHLLSNSFFIISARGGAAIAEISEQGKLIDAKKLKSNEHNQPEGISFMPNYDLLIGDEGGGKKGIITLYKYTK
ncbi:MAG: SdiA-regulated domain-containing protein [Bacteroidetes bacterium]|nr:SdiA-regulated domain-containing protein [Bacteroidota bacterium]